MKLKNSISINTLLKEYEDKNVFNDAQLCNIKLGLIMGDEVSIYANRSYHSGQMQMIRKGLEQHIDISKYADPRVPLRDMIQMYQKLCKQKGVPVK